MLRLCTTEVHQAMVVGSGPEGGLFGGSLGGLGVLDRNIKGFQMN